MDWYKIAGILLAVAFCSAVWALTVAGVILAFRS
jgi:hypothetical protein